MVVLRQQFQNHQIFDPKYQNAAQMKLSAPHSGLLLQ
jgi:hypothetical protein